MFEKIESDWKHSKTEIKNWLKIDDGKNKFEIKIKKDNDEEKKLDEIDEANLVDLLSYLKKEENTLLKLIKDSSPTHLTFEKCEHWDVIHNETTVNNWINDASSRRVSLKLWKDYSEQQLSELKTKSGELKKLFEALKEKEDLFKESNLGEATENNKKTIVFEKYGTSKSEDSTWKWMHIKDAIKEWIKEEWGEDKINKIKVKGDSKTLIEETGDDKLTGLLKHLKDKQEDDDNKNSSRSSDISVDSDDDEEENVYESIIGTGDLILEKKNNSNNHWERVKNES